MWQKKFNQSSIKHGTETTVQEILGYDPFVKELPEKWYVSVTNETVKDINIFKSTKRVGKIMQSTIK